MKEELTTKMHSEFSISKEDDDFLKAGVIWKQNDIIPYTEKELKERCNDLDISFSTLMKHKQKWQSLILSSKKR